MAKPPFDHYPGSADAAAGAGGRAKDQQATFDALKTNLSGQSDKASQEASGDIQESVTASTSAPEGEAGDAAAASLIGGASINHFANAIRTYNGHVDDLNERWEREKKNDFGVADDAGHEDDNSDAENDAARAALVSEKRAELERELEEDRKGYEDDLEDAADFAATMLIAGPTRSTVLALVMTGDIDTSAAAETLGTSISVLNSVRMWVASVKGGIGLKDNIPALAQYLANKDLNKLTRGSMLTDDVKQKLRTVVRKNSAAKMPFDQRVQAYKEAKKGLRTQALRDANKPGNLFGKYGELPTGNKKVPAYRKFLHHTGKVGKYLPWLGMPAGAYTVADTVMNWEGTADDWNNVIGGSATITSSGVAAALAAGMAVPGGIVVIGTVAGVVALGSLAYSYREEIADGASWLYDKSGLDSVVNGTTDLVKDIGDSLPDIDMPDVDLPDMPW